MIDVMFFSYRSTDAWWQYLAEKLEFTTSTCVVSDVRGDGTINIVDDFYANIRNKECADFAIQHFSENTCDDMIRRCRVLRNLNKPLALSMIGAMWLTLDSVFEEHKPRLAMSFTIDRYVLDILARVSQSHGIRFLEMTVSIVPDHVMFMDRGQLIRVREPCIDEITDTRHDIINDTFIPSYVDQSKKYNHRQFWKTFIIYKLRGIAFQFIRRLKRDKLNLHYLDALNYLDHKPRWQDYTVLNAFNHDWETKLHATPRNRRVFLGLQLLPEASLDYWLKDLSLLDNEQLMLDICDTLGKAGFTVFVKDHPQQFGFRKRRVIQCLKKLPSIVLVPYSTPAAHLLKECDITVTCTGTIGFQSAIAGACSIVSDAYYSNETNFIHFKNSNEIASLPDKIAEFYNNRDLSNNTKLIDALLNTLLAASAPGDLLSFRKFDKTQPQHIKRTEKLIESLNRYLPQFLSDRL